MKKAVIVRLLLSALFLGSLQVVQAQNIATIAGGGSGGDGSAATAASLSGPYGVAFDASGNMYIIESYTHTVRKVNTSGVISTFAGNGGPGYSGDGGAATAASLQYPSAVAFDGNGNVFIADQVNNCIRKVDSSGVISTIAGDGTAGSGGDGGAATAARLNIPSGIAFDSSGNLYIADTYNNRIRKIDTSGIISTIAGRTGGGGYSGDGGAATAAQLYYPWAVAIDRSGNIFIADASNYRIRKVNTSGIISTYAGTGRRSYSGDGGAATAAGITESYGIATDAGGNLYIADFYNNNVRKVSASGTILTFTGTGTAGYSGDGGAATAAQLNGPTGVAVDASGNVFIADLGNSRVRRVSCLALPAISGPSILCGTTITLTNATTGGTWSTLDTSIAMVSAGGVVTGVTGGTATISYSTTNICGTTTTTTRVTVRQAPTVTSVSPLMGATGSSVTITGSNFNSTPASNVVWFGATKATVDSGSSSTLDVTAPVGATYTRVSVTDTGTGCGLTGYAQYPYLPTFDTTPYIRGVINFDTRSNFTTANNHYAVAICDIDGDGKADLVAPNYNNSRVSVFRNTSSSGSISSSSFATRVEFATGSLPISVAIADLNGDGKPDLAVVNRNSNTVSIFRNTSSAGSITSSSFAAKVDFATGTDPRSVAIGDLDRDGRPDLAVAAYSTSKVSVLRNTGSVGSISFATKVDFTTATNPVFVAIGDLDGDGMADMAVTNYSSSSVSVFRNTSTTGTIGSSSFATKVDFSTGSKPYSIAIGDLDGDGKPDFAVANFGSDTVSVFRNTASSGSISSSSFASRVNFATGNAPYSVAIGDINGDGKADLAVANDSSNTLSVFRNTGSSGSIGTGSFATRLDFATGTNPTGVAIGDMDGDGRADLAVGDLGSGSVSVLRNNPTYPVVNGSSLCLGRSRVFTGSITGGTWSCSAAGIATVNSTTGLVTALASGAAIVTYTVSGGVDTALVTITPAPYISSVSPLHGQTGGSVTISGSNFNSIPTNNVVWLGATRATVSSGSSSSLTVTAPSGATYQPVSVTDTGAGCALTGFAPLQYLPTFDTTPYVTGVVNFDTLTNFTSGSGPYSIAIGDLDGDGKPDLAVANYYGNSISVYRNTSSSGSISSGSFATRVDFTTGSYPTSVAIGDLDGDGKADMAVANFSSNTVSVFRNTSTSGSISAGSFATRADFATGSHPFSVAIGDLDGDGKPDLAAPNSYDNSISVYRNTSSSGSISSGSFATRVDFTTGVFPVSVAIGDIDGDGKVDLVVVNRSSSNTVSVFRNTSSSGSISSGSFATRVDFTTGSYPISAAIGDLDGDGKADLAVANYISSTVSVLRNTSSSGSINSGSFATNVEFTTGSYPSSVSIGDLNGDGKPDLAVTSDGTSSVSVLRNTSSSGSISSSSFAANVGFTTGSRPWSVAVGDLDGDDKADLAVANFGSGTVSLLRNSPLYPIAGAGPVCIGTRHLLTDSTTGGTWSSSDTTIAIVNSTTGVVTGIVAGTAIVTYSVIGGWDTALVTVTLTPTITSVTPLHGDAGSSVTISGTNFNPTASSNVVWFGATQAAVSSGSSGSLSVITPVGATYMRVTVTDTGAGCGLTGYAQYPYLPTFDNTPFVSGIVNFDARTSFSGGSGTFSVAIGDLDGDGKADLAVANYYSSTVSVFRNTSSSGSISSSSFASPVDFATGSYPLFVAIGDLDGDGKADLVTANEVSNNVSVLRNTSSSGSISAGSFAAHVDFSTGHFPTSVAIGDLDGDGKADIAATSVSASAVSVLRNTSSSGSINSGSFASYVNFSAGSGAYAAAIGDLDGDGKADLAVANNFGNSVSVLRNTSTSGSIGSGSFAANVDFTTGEGPISVAIGDLDGDGMADLVVANANENTVSVFHNTSSSGSITSGSFDAKEDFTTGYGPVSVAIGDLDGDGKADMAVANNSNNSVSVLRNTSSSGSINSGSFAAKVDFSAGNGTNSLAIGDLDGDGKPDVAEVNLYDNTVSVLRNNPLYPIVGVGAFCVGSIQVLTDSTSGGTWSSSDTSIAIVNSTTGVVTGTAGGTATITYTVAGGFTTTTVTIDPVLATGYTIDHYAGLAMTSTSSGDGGAASVAGLGLPRGITVDGGGNLYIAESYGNKIRKITPDGIISTVAGTGSLGFSGDGGAATAAELNNPNDVAVDQNGNLYISDAYYPRIRKVDTNGVITTIAGTGTAGYSGDGGPATAAMLGGANSINVDAGGNVYIADASNTIRKVSTSGTITTVAGTGTSGYSGDGGLATAAELNSPTDVLTDASGNMYISEYGNHTIRKVSTTGIITTIVGTGTAGYSDDGSAATATVINAPGEMAFDASGNLIFIEQGYPRLRIITNTGTIRTIGGTGDGGYSASGGPSTTAAIGHPYGLAIDANGNIYISSSSDNNLITKLTPSLDPIAGASAVCIGASIPFTHSIPGGTWSSSAPSVASVSTTGEVYGLSAGTATIIYAASNACGSAITAKGITVDTAIIWPAAISGSSSVCTGSTITLATTTPDGVWSVDSTALASVSTAGIVTATAYGTANVSYSVTNGCGIGYSSFALTIIPTPGPGTITAPSAICTGSSASLSDSTPGGTWASTNPSVASISSTGVVTAIRAGTTGIVYFMFNACGAAFHTASLDVVSPTVSSITGVTGVCSGATTTLANATSDGTWTTSDASVASVSSTGVVTGLSAGAATISYSVTNACGTNAATTNVTVTTLSAGTISGATSLCQYDSILLASSVIGGHWGVIDATVATISATGRVTGIAAGSTGIYYAVSNSCGTASASTTITITSAPVAGTISGASTLCVGSSSTLSSTATGGTWSNVPPTRGTITTAGILTGIAAGADTVYYTVTNGCGTSRSSAVVTISPLPTAGTLSTVTGLTPGATATITSTVSGGTWSLNNYVRASISTGGVITGLSAGSDSAIYTVTNSCGSVRAYRSFSVTGATGAGTISGPSAVCIGSTITLTSTVSGGTWSSSYAPVASVTSGGGVVRGNAAGIIAITYTVGTSTSTYPVTVTNSTVAAIAGATSVCPGASTTFTDATTGGTWSNMSTTIGSINGSTGAYYGISSGADSVKYTVVNACGTFTVRKAVTVTSPPSILSLSGALSTVCVGSSASFTYSMGGGAWSLSNATVATISASTATSATVRGMSAGIDTLSYTITGTCGLTSSVRRAMTVNPLPTVGAGASSTMLIGASATLTNTVSGGVWSTVYPTIASVNATTGAVRARAAGLDTIKYKTTNTCGTATAIYLVTVTASKPGTTEMEVASANDIQVYPNPSNGILTISLTGDFGTTNHTIRVSDATGRLVLEQQEATDKFNIDLSNQASGMYLLRIVTGSQVHEVKVVKE